ncbi:MAG: LAGLIDADG family homing endonuclease, partial [Candidatus Diapherotrites archaeon]
MQSEIDFDENFAAIHAYLCADGYVVRNPPSQKVKYYRAGLRNTCQELLLDFQSRFENVFGVAPRITGEWDRSEKGSKEIYYYLTNRFGSFYSADWSAPKFTSKKTAAVWLRAFFDCEGWVTCKGRQSRLIAMDSINHNGLEQIKVTLLNFFGISSQIRPRKGRKTGTLFIFGKENLIRYEKDIGFLHPKKARRLKDAIDSFVSYALEFPTDKTEL